MNELTPVIKGRAANRAKTTDNRLENNINIIREKLQANKTDAALREWVTEMAADLTDKGYVVIPTWRAPQFNKDGTRRMKVDSNTGELVFAENTEPVPQMLRNGNFKGFREDGTPWGITYKSLAKAYPLRAPEWQYADMVSIVLGASGVILLDYDGNHKMNPPLITPAEALKALDYIGDLSPVQYHANGSRHWLFTYESIVDENHSNDGWQQGVDLKRGSQLQHIKPGKVYAFPHVSELPRASEKLIAAFQKADVKNKAEFKGYPEKTTPFGKVVFETALQQISEKHDGTAGRTLMKNIRHVANYAAGGEINPHQIFSEVFTGIERAGMPIPGKLATDATLDDVLYYVAEAAGEDSFNQEWFDRHWKAGLNKKKALSSHNNTQTAAAPVQAVEISPDPANFLDWQSVDLENPPGLAGIICKEINRGNARPLPMASVPAALHLLAICGTLARRTPFGVKKLSLLTISIALTAAGKDAGQEYLKATLRQLQASEHVCGRPRTDKDMITNLLDSEGCVLYVIDEAHELLNAMNDPRASQYTKSIAEAILVYATTALATFSGTHKREFLEVIAKKRKALKKDLADAEEDIQDKDPTGFQRKLVAQTGLTALDAREKSIVQGIEKPVSNMMLASTPGELAKRIDIQNIDSGFIGRSLFFLMEESRAMQVDTDVELIASPATNSTLFTLIKDEPRHIKADEEAELMLKAIREWVEVDELINMPIYGGLYARLFERVKTVASILAVADCLITADMVRYAFAVTMASLKSVAQQERENAAESVEEAVQLRIITLLKKYAAGHPEQRVKKEIMRNSRFTMADRKLQATGQKPLFDTALDNLIEAGRVHRSKRSRGFTLHL